jgi:hypothetical protein
LGSTPILGGNWVIPPKIPTVFRKGGIKSRGRLPELRGKENRIIRRSNP